MPVFSKPPNFVSGNSIGDGQVLVGGEVLHLPAGSCPWGLGIARGGTKQGLHFLCPQNQVQIPVQRVRCLWGNLPVPGKAHPH